MHLTGLAEAFSDTVNPQSVFQSESQIRALALLSSVSEDGRNLRLLTGDPGVGKTLLLFRLLEQFRSFALATRLFWTQLTGIEFLRYFLHELEAPHMPNNIGQARQLLGEVLEREFCNGRKVIVAIDEAQNLRMPTL